ncbi:Beta-lactamase [Thermobacillus xylanilyticus]|uniref:Beta-lactamase n=1 Tax=Thermobacillus xylanilyticus TaxID=76633 RepID=A0ABM8V760_THEXY|nr:serine hydrolase domain-containing protein [Thermobacillus xylanilyticus]CAG5091120.1 Beta-lactamase [Thermobacillus xylanilyticus]
MSRFRMLDELLNRLTEDKLPGCACVVSRHGKVLYEGYAGSANLEQGKPITPDTVYRLFSMTKVVVCTAALMLYERGHFLLDDPLAAYIPEYEGPSVVRKLPDGGIDYEPAGNPIRIKHLFTMTSGMPYHFGDSEPERKIRRVLDELRETHGNYDLQTEVRAMAKAQVPLAFEPGTRWLYGYSHDVLGALIEVISGKTLGRFLQEEIFDPLGMKDTGYRFKGDIVERMASVYQKSEDGKLVEVPGPIDILHHPEAKYEGGGVGLYSTARDYAVFTQMLACGGVYNGERIIGRKTIELMRRNHLNEQQMNDFANGHHAGYGYGLGVRTLVDPAAAGANSSIGEFGWSGAAGTWTSIDPAEGVSIVFMQQMYPSIYDEYVHHRVRNAAYACID